MPRSKRRVNNSVNKEADAYSKAVATDRMSLGERLSVGAMGNVTHSGRGHGRKTNHGRLKPKKPVNKNTRREMLYFVRDLVQKFRQLPPEPLDHIEGRVFPKNFSSHDFANFMAKDIQYFDCDEIVKYVHLNYEEMYPDKNVPPSTKVRLPAPAVGLYHSDSFDSDGSELMFICVPMEESSGTNFFTYYLTRDINDPNSDYFDEDTIPYPYPVGEIDSVKGIWTIGDSDFHYAYQMKSNCEPTLRIVAALLQTINNPRFVRRAKTTVSVVKKQNIRKVLRDFIPEQWNMVGWNVNEPVDSKNYEEGKGGRQGLHFRRGFYRRAESHWENAQLIDGVWRKYIEGYEAGHPAFGVKKSYHLPRIKGENK